MITDREQTAVDAARKALTAAKNSLTFEGVGSTVDQTLVNLLRVPIAAFQSAAVLPDVTPSPGYTDKLKRLKDEAVAHWKSAHDANYAVYLNTRNIMLNTPISAVSEEISEHIDSSANNHHERHFDLSQRVPQYFAAAKRDELLAVSCSFNGSGGGTGALNLSPGAGNHLVSTGGMDGKGSERYMGNKVYYNHANTELHIVLEGGGFSKNVNDNHHLKMNKVVFRITRNQLALPENAAFKQKYKKAAEAAEYSRIFPQETFADDALRKKKTGTALAPVNNCMLF